MSEKSIELLRDEAQRLLLVEIELFKKMLDESGVVAEARAEEQQTFDRSSIPKIIEVLQGEMAKLEGLEMVLAVVGTMKAGKSTTINAIIGTEVLPNRNRPMTALPTLIRHTPGQTEPLLKFKNSQPINTLISVLHDAIKSPVAKEKLKGLERNPDMDELLLLINKKTKLNQSYQGTDAIFWFLKSLNDLVRLSSELDVEFPFDSYDEIHEMPVIEVEFAHLREMNQNNGRLTLLDTPGPNEAGQQHLRKMLTEQLRKASAVLAVLDFTQLKSDADADIRKELEQIAKVAEGRLYTLVNKFDQKDRHGDNEDQIKNFVAENLMEGIIQKNDVYPVSSRWGYLANRAKHEILLNKQLPAPDEQAPWVADFADLAFGASWEESDLQDNEGVQYAAEKLWKKSLFSKPMENVIRAAHTRSAAFAIDSAAAKLIDNAEKMNNFFGIRETALAKNTLELQAQIKSLLNDIDRVKNSEHETQEQVNKTLTTVTKDTKELFDKIKQDALKTLDEYFKEGKAIEREQAIKKKQQELQKNNTLATWGHIFNNVLSQKNNYKKTESDFDPENPIMRFEGSKEAEKLMQRIQTSVEGEIKYAEKTMQEAMSALLEDFRKNFNDHAVAAAQKIASDTKERMTEDGICIDIKLPNSKALSLDFSADEMLEDIISKKTKTVTRRRRQKGLWGGLCSMFGTSDWGWEDYKHKEQYFEIDIRKVQLSVSNGIQTIFNGLDKSISDYIAEPLKKEISEFFNEFKSKIEKIRGDLLQTIRDQEYSKSEQEALAARLANLKKNVPAILHDSNELKNDIGPLIKHDVMVSV